MSPAGALGGFLMMHRNIFETHNLPSHAHGQERPVEYSTFIFARSRFDETLHTLPMTASCFRYAPPPYSFAVQSGFLLRAEHGKIVEPRGFRRRGGGGRFRRYHLVAYAASRGCLATATRRTQKLPTHSDHDADNHDHSNEAWRPSRGPGTPSFNMSGIRRPP